MHKFSTVGGAAACGALIALVSGARASAAENISADVGLSYNSHFVSYGVDVWGGGGANNNFSLVFLGRGVGGGGNFFFGKKTPLGVGGPPRKKGEGRATL